MRYIAAIFLLFGLYGIVTSQLGAGILSFCMALFVCYCHKKMKREDAQRASAAKDDTDPAPRS